MGKSSGKDEKLSSPLARLFLFIETHIRSFLALFYLACFLVFISEAFIHRHPHAPQEFWLGFHSVFGFIAFVIAVFVGRFILRPLVNRSEDYYD